MGFWNIFNTLALGFNLALAINLVIILFLAVQNGGGVLVTANDFSEQGIEMVLFPLFILMGIVAFIRRIKWLLKF